LQQKGGGVTPFHDLQEYLAIPRVEGLRLAPAGDRLVAVVKALSPDRKKYLTALWEVDPAGQREARRLTWSTQGESSPEFLPDGTLLFTSARPDPQADPTAEEEPERATLWALPPAGGEASRVAARPGGIADVMVARECGTVVATVATLPGVGAVEADRRKLREDAGITAILHEDYPVRDWDHEIGPDQAHLVVLETGEPGLEARDLTSAAGLGLVGQHAAVTPDGSAVITGWWVPFGRAEQRSELVLIDVATGARRTLLGRDGWDFSSPGAAPDGRAVICVGESHTTATQPPAQRLWLVPLDGSEPRELTAGLDLWPGEAAWSPDSGTVYFTADATGRRPVFRADLDTGAIEQVTHDDAAYGDLSVGPDGASLYALRLAIDAPAAPVRIDPATGAVTVLKAPGGSLPLPGRVTEVSANAPDGVAVRGWLVLPEQTAEPAPLLLWVHGGPFSSWNGWSWRWNPWVMAAHGYAVLLPDPALSTGYGQHFIRRGHGRWGEATLEDLTAITDAVLARDDIDQNRTAMMGGSFGGYMANWIAGHTDRFDAIVSHASLWKMDLMAVSDEMRFLAREFGDVMDSSSRWVTNDPARHAAKIRTPMLVIHGDKDYRVPMANALWLWYDLISNEVDAKFLYYPDENHWILGPGNAAIWYETVLAFLAQHVLHQPWHRPAGI
jgi:dipeptidyl aminopeptidase/acylaminoacyl peptidase